MFIDPYPNKVTIEQGTSVTLVCRVVGTFSPVTYQWTCPNNGCTGNKRPFNEVLLIDVVQKSKEEGDYTCTVSLTEDGVNVAEAFNLGVNGKLSSMLSNISWTFAASDQLSVLLLR